MLYLHEIIDIVGDGQQAYLAAVADRARHSETQGISRLVGTFRVIGSTNRWPRAVNLWEMDGWSHWAETLDRQFLPAKKDPALAPWWNQAAQWRSGGFDRILEPAAFAPTLADLKMIGLRAWVCVHTITRTRPGAGERYLDAIKQGLVGCLEAKGLTLLGAYRVAMRSDEVLTLWGAPNFRDLCALYETCKEDNGLRNWQRRAQILKLESETMWLVPSDQSFLYPGE